MKTAGSGKIRTKHKHKFVLFILLVLLLSACTSQTFTPTPPPPNATLVLEPTPVPPLTAVSTHASLPDGSLVYGDPDGRFSMPLVGDWTPVGIDDSYGHFKLAEPELEMYVITAESEAMEIPALWIWGDLDGWIPPRKSRLEMESTIAEYNKDFTILYDQGYGHEWPSSWTSRAVDWVLGQLEE